MMTAVGQKLNFERHLAPARRCRPFGIMPSACFFASPPRDLIQGVKRSGNNEQWELRCSLRSSPKGEAVGRRRGNTLRPVELGRSHAARHSLRSGCLKAVQPLPASHRFLTATVSMRLNQRFLKLLVFPLHLVKGFCVCYLASSSLCFEQALAYYLSPWQLFAFCVILPMILAFTGLWISRKIIPSHFVNQSHDVTGPFFSTLGTIYGVFLAFVVSTVWQEFSNTSSNLVQEARYLGDLYFASAAFPHPTQEELQNLLRNYRDSVVNQEWKSMERGEANPDSVHLLKQIAAAYMRYQPKDATQISFLHESIQNLASMTGLRASRIDDSSSSLLTLLWFVILTGAMILIGFTFLFGAHSFKTQAVMTMLLTAVTFMTFYTIISLDFPFTGGTKVSSEPFQNLEMK